MTISVEDVKLAVKAAIEEERQNFWVPAEEHWRHHEQLRQCIQTKPEWEENHKYVSEIRRMGGHVKKVGIGTAVAGATAWAIKALWFAAK